MFPQFLINWAFVILLAVSADLWLWPRLGRYWQRMGRARAQAAWQSALARLNSMRVRLQSARPTEPTPSITQPESATANLQTQAPPELQPASEATATARPPLR